MKQYTLSALTAAAAALLTGCGKDHPAVPQPESFPTYLPLKTGNYWVYRQYEIDILTGRTTPLAQLDSCFIQKDTVIRGQTYAKLVRPSWNGFNQNRFLRDSLQYLVDHHGTKLFSSQPTNKPLNIYYLFNGLNDTLVKATSTMVDQHLAVTVPAGTFSTSSYQTFFDYYRHNPVPFGYSRIMKARYAENVGVIAETLPFYLGQPAYVERRLVRYHLAR